MENLKNEKALKIASNVLFAVGILVALLIGILSGFEWEKNYGGDKEIEAVNWVMWGVAILVGVFTSAFAYMLTVIAEISTTLKNKQQAIANNPQFAYFGGGTLNDFVMLGKVVIAKEQYPPVRGADFAITVSGDSMAPEYPSGSQVIIKKINERAFIDWGKVYVLDTCNGVVVKRLMPADDGDASKVKCVSINPSYPPFEVNLLDVYGVYRVMLCMAMK